MHICNSTPHISSRCGKEKLYLLPIYIPMHVCAASLSVSLCLLNTCLPIIDHINSQADRNQYKTHSNKDGRWNGAHIEFLWLWSLLERMCLHCDRLKLHFYFRHQHPATESRYLTCPAAAITRIWLLLLFTLLGFTLMRLDRVSQKERAKLWESVPYVKL